MLQLIAANKKNATGCYCEFEFALSHGQGPREVRVEPVLGVDKALGSPLSLTGPSVSSTLCSENKRRPTLAPTSHCKKSLWTYGGNILLYRLHNLHPQGSDRFAYTDL